MNSHKTIVCPKCGQSNESGLHLCTGCGFDLWESRHSYPVQRFLSSENITETPWPIHYIVLGLGILIFFEAFPYLIKNNVFFLKPWLFSHYLITAHLIFDLILIIFVLLLFKRRGICLKTDIITLKIFFKELIEGFYAVLIIGLVITPIIIFVNIFFKDVSLYDNWRFLEYAPANFGFVVFFSILSFTLGPISEELFFRGFLYNALKSRLPVLVAIIIQATIFALVHPYGIVGRTSIFLFAIALVIVYERRESLLAPVCVHGLANALKVVPLMILLVQNYHIPAATWEEAQVNPVWVSAVPSKEIERQEDGLKQWQYAINKWGSKGSKKWKKELNAFNSVSYWFPNDREACAKAGLGKITIYNHHLGDYRRGIIEANILLTKYPEERKEAAMALVEEGQAYLMLKDFRSSREYFNRALNEYKYDNEVREAAQRGNELLDKLENN